MTEGERIYWTLVRENERQAQNDLVAFMEGEIEVLPCSGDRLRQMIIEALDRALGHG